MRVPEPLDLDRVKIDARVARRLPESLATRRGVLLFSEDEEKCYAACLDPEDDPALEAVERAAGRPVVALRAEPESLGRAIERIFARRPRPSGDAGDEAVRLVDELLHEALVEEASDIHLEPTEDRLRVRFRVDGRLEPRLEIAGERAQAVLNRVKVLAGLDIAEKRAPQDGRFSVEIGGGRRALDVRVAVLPTRDGERATLRLLALGTESLTLERLGMEEQDLETFRRAIRRPHGLVLLTGPTGSGKTTTLYAALRELDVERLNVLTIEDPVEYDIPGVSQTEVDSTDRVTFHKALRSMLRHDPDILMIGEIRDRETADVAIKAALTGHLVFSTLHTNSSVSAVTRLVDMGVPAFLVAATLRLVVAQRLVRRLCSFCAEPARPELYEIEALGLPRDAAVLRERGCFLCRRSGFAGRVGLFESFEPSPALRAAVSRGEPEEALLSRALGDGLRTLRDDAVSKVLAGVTTPAEAMSAVEAC